MLGEGDGGEMRLLECEVSVTAGTPVVTVHGELDVYTVADLQSSIDTALAGGASRVVIDVAGLEYIDSAGLALLATTGRRLGYSGGEVVLRAPGRNTMRLLEIAGMAGAFAITT